MFKGWFLSLGAAWETAQEGEGQGNATPRDELDGSTQRRLAAASCASLSCATGVGGSQHNTGSERTWIGVVAVCDSADSELTATADCSHSSRQDACDARV